MSGFAQEEKTLRVLNMNFWVFKNWVEQITYDQQSNQGRSFGKLSPDRLALGMLRLIRKPVLCVCSYFCSPEKFQVSDILCKMVSNCMIEELNFCAVYNVSTAHDDEQIEAHNSLLRKQSECGF